MITVRKHTYTPNPNLPRHWFSGNRFRSYWYNSYNVLVCDAEKFIVRTSSVFLPRITDESKRAEIRDCFAQEMQHARTHDAFHEQLAMQGYKIDSFLKVYRFLSFDVLEPLFGQTLCLATAAAIEHMNTVTAEMGLEDPAFDTVDPEVRALLRWHFAEEIEHKAAIFDLLRGTNPSWWVRAAGMVLAYVNFIFDMLAGVIFFMASDGGPTRASLREGLDFLFLKERALIRLTLASISYLKPSFHPDERKNLGLSETVFATAGRPGTDRP